MSNQKGNKELKLAHVETSKHIVTVKREDVIADGVWDNHKNKWLLSATNRQTGDEIASTTCNNKTSALLWCMNKCGFLKRFDD